MIKELKLSITPEEIQKVEKMSDRKHFAMDRMEWEDKRDGYVAEAVQKVLREFIGGIGINSKDKLMKMLYEKVKEKLSGGLGGEKPDRDEWPEKKISEMIDKYLQINSSRSDDLEQVILKLHKN